MAKQSHRALLLDLAGDGAEGRAEIGADESEGGDCRDRDQSGDQGIFDSGNPGLVPDEIVKQLAQPDSPRVRKVSCADCARIFNRQ